MDNDLSNIRVLIVDDDPDIIEFISYNLKKENFQIHASMTGEDAIRIARDIIPDVILLDIMIPGMDGIEVCEELRKINSLNDTIIAFLTARGEDYSQIAGFEAGGDDYITKPIKPKVLISRIKALVKRRRDKSTRDQGGQKERQALGFFVDRERFVVVKDGQDLILPKKEFELLNLLISKPEKVFTREEIYQAVWGEKIIVGDRTIDVHIRKLREKIGQEHIFTIKGVGYKFVV